MIGWLVTPGGEVGIKSHSNTFNEVLMNLQYKSD